jgi:alpha-1,2-mannosyltransferase
MRTLSAVVCFAIGAVVGWPFSLLLAVPFVLEEVSVWGGDRVQPSAQLSWLMGRWKRLILCGLIASFVFVSESVKCSTVFHFIKPCPGARGLY